MKLTWTWHPRWWCLMFRRWYRKEYLWSLYVGPVEIRRKRSL